MDQIREINLPVKNELKQHFHVDSEQSMPLFGYPPMNFSPPEHHQNLNLMPKSVSQSSSNKVRINSKWEPISNQIICCATLGKSLTVAKSLESHENHEHLMAEVMRFFASGDKITRNSLKYKLLKRYVGRLKNKERVKIQIMKLYADEA